MTAITTAPTRRDGLAVTAASTMTTMSTGEIMTMTESVIADIDMRLIQTTKAVRVALSSTTPRAVAAMTSAITALTVTATMTPSLLTRMKGAEFTPPVEHFTTTSNVRCI